MTSVQVTRHVATSPEAAFELFSDVRHAAERVSAITASEVLTDGPVGLGTRFRETRVMFGKTCTEEMEFVVFEPGRRYVLSAHSGGSDYRTSYEFAPANGGTDVAVEFRCTPQTFLAKLMTPLMMLMSGTMKTCVSKDMDDLAAVLEGDASAG